MVPFKCKWLRCEGKMYQKNTTRNLALLLGIVVAKELCISVVGLDLYVPYEQNLVVETTFYFCPNAECIKRSSSWVKLTPPTRITIDSSATREEIQNMRDSPLNALLV